MHRRGTIGSPFDPSTVLRLIGNSTQAHRGEAKRRSNSPALVPHQEAVSGRHTGAQARRDRRADGKALMVDAFAARHGRRHRQRLEKYSQPRSTPTVCLARPRDHLLSRREERSTPANCSPRGPNAMSSEPDEIPRHRMWQGLRARDARRQVHQPGRRRPARDPRGRADCCRGLDSGLSPYDLLCAALAPAPR